MKIVLKTDKKNHKCYFQMITKNISRALFYTFKEYITKQKYTKYIVVEVETHTYMDFIIFQTKVI